MYKISFEPAAFILSFVCLVYIIATKRRQYRIPKGIKNKFTSQHFVFLLLLISNITSISSSVLGVYLTSIIEKTGPNDDLIFWQYLFHFLYFVFHASLSCLFSLYILNVTGSSVGRSKLFYCLFLAPYVLSELLILTNYWTEFAFYMDSSNGYHRGVLMPLLYAMGAVYVVLGFVFFFKYKKAISKVDSVAIGSVIIVATLGIVVQAIRSDILIELFAEAIAFLIMMMVLEEKRGLIDQVTGLLNRTAFIDENRKLIETNQSYELVLFVISNMDNYQQVIDEREQDHVLLEISTWLTQTFPEDDIYTYHINKFACLTKKSGESKRIVEKILDRFSVDWRFGSYKHRIDAVVTSLKIPEEIRTMTELENIISSSYTKQRSGSFYVPFEDVFELSNIHNRERQLKSAIEENKLTVSYQPIWSYNEKKTVACEALIRVNTPELKDLSPEVYIPVAERTGLIREIGLFVFEEVCRFLTNERLKKTSVRYIEINMSLFQFLYDDLVESFETIRKKYNVDPGMINLEITETASASDVKRFEETIEKFKSLGYSFTLDDFGTGYSNLVGLLQSDYKNVKIDKSLLWRAETDEKTRSLLSGVIGLVRSSISGVVQEGVETAEQLDMVTGFGCDLIQGYYFSKPISGEAFLDYLEKE